jgi:hypothetical protein
MRPIATPAERSAPPLAMRKIEKKRFGLNQRGVLICFLDVSGFRFFILPISFLVLAFLISVFTEVLQEIRRDITPKVGFAALNRSLAKAFGVKWLPPSPRLRRAKEALKWIEPAFAKLRRGRPRITRLCLDSDSERASRAGGRPGIDVIDEVIDYSRRNEKKLLSKR